MLVMSSCFCPFIYIYKVKNPQSRIRQFFWLVSFFLIFLLSLSIYIFFYLCIYLLSYLFIILGLGSCVPVWNSVPVYSLFYSVLSFILPMALMLGWNSHIVNIARLQIIFIFSLNKKWGREKGILKY